MPRGLRAPAFERTPAVALIAAGALALFALSGSLVVALAVALVMGSGYRGRLSR